MHIYTHIFVDIRQTICRYKYRYIYIYMYIHISLLKSMPWYPRASPDWMNSARKWTKIDKQAPGSWQRAAGPSNPKSIKAIRIRLVGQITVWYILV